MNTGACCVVLPNSSETTDQLVPDSDIWNYHQEPWHIQQANSAQNYLDTFLCQMQDKRRNYFFTNDVRNVSEFFESKVAPGPHGLPFVRVEMLVIKLLFNSYQESFI
ncbi:hypothetical protein ABEB36_000774, partial [Hypothenemus hampei]